MSTTQDWWNSTSFANYYRTWNVVVHDWLYYYVYRDFLWVSHHALTECFVFFMINRQYNILEITSIQCVMLESSLCFCCFRCLISVSEQRRCSLCSQCLLWSMSTFSPYVLASFIQCSSACSCALEVRTLHSVAVLTDLCFENSFNAPIVTILLMLKSLRLNSVQWCSTSFYMTEGKDPFGMSSCGLPSSWVRGLLSVCTRRSGMPSAIVPLKRYPAQFMYISIGELFEHNLITATNFSSAIFSWVGDTSLLELPERPVVGLREAVIFARVISRSECLSVGQILLPTTFV